MPWREIVLKMNTRRDSISGPRPYDPDPEILPLNFRFSIRCGARKRATATACRSAGRAQAPPRATSPPEKREEGCGILVLLAALRGLQNVLEDSQKLASGPDRLVGRGRPPARPLCLRPLRKWLPGITRKMSILLPNNQRHHRTLHIQ